ncbi:hypothetical protein JYU34_005904 [Plutella xylostella]|uniref:Uncharacterized protein n=1 Tax=Plutella xylostella TaxID=51655 RepID=A0ABQ7QUG6_PLUXY|nr:hypothetical protein JYU34_005904 [Plutella xylostella]
MKVACLCCLLVLVLVCLVAVDAHPLRARNMDYLEALRRMQQIPQWHCMRYRRVQPHGPCSRWWLMRRH